MVVQKHKILLIEDDQLLIPYITEVLQMGSYEHTTARSGAQALQLLESFSPDLILSDIQLPDINGIELFKRIKTRVQIPYVFLTSQESELDIVLALELGAEEYIVKPFKPRELLVRIKRVLQRRTDLQPNLSATPQPGFSPKNEVQRGLYINEISKEMRCGGHALDISVIEFDILHHLIQHPGQIFSRNHLLETFWTDNFDINDRIVDTHISHIRKKITPFQEVLGSIKTHRGRGYSFVPGPSFEKLPLNPKIV